MSHFSVLIVGDDYEKQLAPFHEFECTNINDEYVQDLDITDEVREEYENAQRSMMVCEATGERLSAWDDRFFRDPTAEKADRVGPLAGSGAGRGLSWHSKDWGDGRGYRTKIHYTPDGWRETDVPAAEMESFAEYISGGRGYSTVAPGENIITGPRDIPRGASDEYPHRFGYVLISTDGSVVKVIKRSNPNCKWDYYRLGGRWRGFFPIKHESITTLSRARIGGDGWDTPATKFGHADQCYKADVNFEVARDAAAAKAAASWAEWATCLSGCDRPASWATFYKRYSESNGQYSIEQARDDYNAQVPIARWKATSGGFGCPVDDFGFDKEAYLKCCRNAALVTFAVVKDGQWYERGSMGWWGCVSGEKGLDEWSAQVQALYDDLPGDTVLTVVDCHI